MSIPTEVGVLGARFDEQSKIRRVILVVLLLGKDETPREAVDRGYQAFVRALASGVAAEIPNFVIAGDDDKETKKVVSRISERVGQAVRGAISDRLTQEDKVQVLLGTMDLDYEIGFDYKSFSEIPSNDTRFNPIPFGLTFGNESSADLFAVEGQFIVIRVLTDPCQGKVDAVKIAQERVDSIRGEIKELRGSPEGLSEALTFALARRLETLDLPVARAELGEALRVLQSCRDRGPFSVVSKIAELGDL